MAKKNLSPFTREETNAFKAMLYNVNASNHCCNLHPSVGRKAISSTRWTASVVKGFMPMNKKKKKIVNE